MSTINQSDISTTCDFCGKETYRWYTTNDKIQCLDCKVDQQLGLKHNNNKEHNYGFGYKFKSLYVEDFKNNLIMIVGLIIIIGSIISAYKYSVNLYGGNITKVINGKEYVFIPNPGSITRGTWVEK